MSTWTEIDRDIVRALAKRCQQSIGSEISPGPSRKDVLFPIQYGQQNQLAVIVALTRLWIEILLRNNGTIERPVPPTVSKALQEIDVRCVRTSLTLIDVARAVNVSAFHLEHLLKKHTGAAFLQHVRQARVARSLDLLADANLSVKEIAAATGFNYVSSFDRAFRRICGCRPSDWRRTTKKGGAVLNSPLPYQRVRI
jgi:transcriptional regulator GlxA family with amidase domain